MPERDRILDVREVKSACLTENNTLQSAASPVPERTWRCAITTLRKPDLGEFLVCTGVGIVSGVAPDVLEPAINPNHRGLGHSLALGTVLAKFAVANCCKENGGWQELQKILAAVAIVSYLAHLVADGCTPKGLPLLGS